MKIEQETKPESSSSGGAVDLRAKLLARRKAQSLQLNDSGGNDGSTSKHKVSKMLARGDEGELEEEEDDDDSDVFDRCGLQKTLLIPTALTFELSNKIFME